MRLVIMGTSAFAVPAMQALRDKGHEIAAVYTQPPRPKGRGHKLQRTPMHDAADALGLAVQTPRTLKTAAAVDELAAIGADLAVVGAYGLLLPQAILDTPRLGCVNLHASALPRWRGAAPIHRALLAGDEETGLSIFQMEAGLDTGPILAMEPLLVTPDMTAADLHDRLAACAAAMIPDVVEGLGRGSIVPMPQPEEGITYAHKITKADGEVDFAEGAEQLSRRIRALHPWPGCWCHYGETRLNILSGHVVEGHGEPGEIVAEPLTIACGEGAFRVDRIQREGRQAMTSAELQRGFAMPVGTQLG